MNRSLKATATLAAAILLTPVSPLVDQFEAMLNSPSDEAFLADLNECTTGLALGSATQDGRPLLWKNRDVGTATQEFHYYDDGRIPFISITYSGEVDEYYGGVNAAGFAVENSNSYNLDGGPYGGDDDGRIHLQALATCRNLDDFQALLDSTNVNGRTLNSNYGAIDAFGNAAMFETAGYEYTRCDAAEAPGGFLVRSNYSYSGMNGNVRQYSWGPHRHDAAYALFRSAVEQNILNPLYVYQSVIRDLSQDDLDPNPLPFEGYYGNYPYGCLPNDEAVCRSSTRGVLVVQGVAANERPDDAILWAMVGSPLTALAVPLWVRAGSVPVELNGPDGSRINRRAIALQSYVYNGFGAVNTWRLTNPQGTGMWDFTKELERLVYDKTQRFVTSPNFSYDRLASFQNEMAQQVADALDAYKPLYPTSNIVAVQDDDGLVLRWGVPEGAPEQQAPTNYKIYGSTTPFREGEVGTLLGETSNLSWRIDNLPRNVAFYRVESIF